MSEPEQEGGKYVPFHVQEAVAAQKSLESAGVDAAAAEEGVPPPTLHSMPPEVLQRLLTMLSVASLGRLAATCKDWERACAAPAVWLSLLQRDFPEQASQLDIAIFRC